MQTTSIPAEYAGMADPGDENERRHATTVVRDLSQRASVYQFGVRWHWKCGPKTGPGAGTCLGGPVRTQQEAYAKAEQHLRDEHDLTVRIHDADNCWCGMAGWYTFDTYTVRNGMLDD